MKTVIMVSGLARSGKDTVSDYMLQKMIERGINVSKLSFAQPMKEILADTFELDLGEVDLLKNNSSTNKVMLYNTIHQGMAELSDFRKILQRFGTEAMKKQFGDDVWVELAHKKLHTDFTIISDWRFKSEWEYFMIQPDVNVISVKVYSNMTEDTNDSHISEIGLVNFDCRHNIRNDYNNLEITKRKVDTLVDSLRFQSNADLGYELTPEITEGEQC